MPSKEQQERQAKFWEAYTAREAQLGSYPTQGHQRMGDVGIVQFPDALPVPSNSTSERLLVPIATPQQKHSRGPAPTIVQATYTSSGNAELVGSSRRSDAPQAEQASSAPSSHRSEVNQESEGYDDPSPTVRYTHSGSPHNNSHDHLPDSTSAMLPPGGAVFWHDDNLLSFWKFKVLRKKGYKPMVDKFPGQTVESLQEVWATHRQRCDELGARWKAAGRPEGPVSEWLG